MTVTPVNIELGPGSFGFDQFPDGEHQPLTVHYYRPPELDENARIIFVMHGMLRDGDRYRDRWLNHAENHGFLLFVPEFDREFYPDSTDYNLAGLVDEEESPEFNDREKWAFHRIELLFNTIRQSAPITAESFGIYGHSAGAQFVHRLVLFHPETSFDVAVAANSGWYTLPCQETDFPYGLADAPVTDSRLGLALQKKLIILVGEDDIDQAHHSLRRTEEALEQGQNRLDRGRTFFETGREASKRLGVSFCWKYASVPDAEHRDRQMSGTAVDYLMGKE